MFYEWRHAEQMSVDRQGQKVNVRISHVHSMAKDKHVGTRIKNEVAVHNALRFSLTVTTCFNLQYTLLGFLFMSGRCCFINSF